MPFDDPALPVPIAGDGIPPPVTVGLTAVPGDEQVFLGWNDSPSSDFAYYNVWQAPTEFGTYELIGTSLISEFLVDIGLDNGTTYWFKVSTVDDFGFESALSPAVSATPIFTEVTDTTPPEVPTGLSATAGDHQVTLDWLDSAAFDFNHFRVYRALASGGPYTQIATRTVSNYVNTGLTNGTAYFFKVSSVDQTGNESAQSSFATATPTGAADTSPPPQPTGVFAIPGDQQITVDWADVFAADLANYKVYRSTGGSFTHVATRTVSNYVDTGLTNGNTYSYRVSAVDTSGNESTLSVVVSAVPTAPVSGGVNIPAGANIQTYVNNNPNGTTFYLAAGTWNNQTVTPKPGNAFIGTLSGSTRLSILDGGNVTQRSIYMSSTVSGVVIKNLIVEDYASPLQTAALGGYGMTNGLIENCEVRFNKAGGLSFGSGTIVRNCFVHHNEQTGMYANGAVGALVDNCEISFNNYLQLYDPGWEAGGSKFLNTQSLILRGNNAHDNHGPGLWTDFQNYLTVMENNTATSNFGPGLFHEVSYDAIIRNNTCTSNGFGYTAWLDGSGILINSSPNVEVYGNTCTNNRIGIGVTYTNRGSGNRGLFAPQNLWIHNNTINQQVNKATGLATNVSGSGVFTTWNNDWDFNTYNIPNPATDQFFDWQGGKTFAQWQAAGQDPSGSVS